MVDKKILLALFILTILISGCSVIDDILKVKKTKVKSSATLTKASLAVEQKICAKKLCITGAYSLQKNTFEFVLVGVPAIKRYLDEQNIEAKKIAEIVELLEVTRRYNGDIKNVIMHIVNTNDAQSSTSATLCEPFQKRGIGCQIKFYAESGNNVPDWIKKGCYIAYADIVPDPIDLLCILISI